MVSSSPTPRSPYSDNDRLTALQLNLAARLPDLLLELGVHLRADGRALMGPCPIHRGDNPSALLLYPSGHSRPGTWRCLTRGCHRAFKGTLLGFVWGVLNGQVGWDGQKKKVGFHEVISWSCQFLGTTIDQIEVDYEGLEKARFAHGIAIFNKKRETPKGPTRAQVRQRLQIPAPCFVERGWDPATLDRFDVGLCLDEGKPFFERAVVPVYDDEGERAVGFTARSIYPACVKCKGHHPPYSFCKPNPKWRHSEGFARERVLYNYWNAKGIIRETGVAILCEGPGDLWKLEQASVRNGLAMFGTTLSDSQQILLEESGAMEILVLTDADVAGRKSAEEIKGKLGRMFRVSAPTPPSHDLGSMATEDVREWLKPLLGGV